MLLFINIITHRNIHT